ncbi:hypothetical protein [Clostridium sp. E02]|uniref:hypothetical protein n=1 Tax=Clostridium sp. E02 TaxID=2487134 RepID=UPI000F52EF58|nr:hypothetical protein [Clostridium sp. E02]
MLLQDMFNKALIDHYAKENPAKGIRLVRDEDKEVRGCFEAGIQPKTVQVYLGHTSLKMTMDLYTLL